MNRNGKALRPLAAAALVIAALVLGGGDAAAANGSWGFFGGLNFADMGDDMDTIGDELAAELAAEFGGTWTAAKGRKTGLGLGAFYFLPTSPTVGIQFEGQYIRRGTNFEITGGGVTIDTAFKLDYIELPILLRLAPGAGNAMRPFFLVGPVVGFKTGADAEVSGGGMSQSVDVGDGFKSTTFGAIGGLGFTVEMGPASSFMLQARYYLGLSNAIDDPVYSAKSGDFGVFAGMEFGLGK